MRLILSILMAFVFSSAFASLPYYPLSFPRDEGAHYKDIPYEYKRLTEWWYFNGKLISDDGEQLSYDVAMFNAAARIGSKIVSVPSVQLQIVDLDHKKNYGGINLYKIGDGEFSTSQLQVSIDENNQLQKNMINGQAVYRLHARTKSAENKLQLDLQFVAATEPVLVNQTGLLPMPDDANTYYYVVPRLKTSGTVTINNKVYHISENHGDSWFDHQWGDFSLRKYGWEYFSIRLDNGLFAHIFLNVEFGSNKVIDGIADIVLPSGEIRYIPYSGFSVTRADYWKDPVTGDNYPQTFIIDFPELNLHMVSKSAFPEQESNGYWEGYTNVEAVYNQRAASGFSYVELVYNWPLALAGDLPS